MGDSEWVGRAVASRVSAPRNVRAPQGRAVGNTHPEKSARKCNRKQTAGRKAGKGETVV